MGKARKNNKKGGKASKNNRNRLGRTRVERRVRMMGIRTRRMRRRIRTTRGRAGITRVMAKARTRTRRVVRIRTRTRRDAVERAPTCCLSLFTTNYGASTWPWNRHLRSALKISSLTEKDRAAGDLRENRFGIYKLVVHSYL